MKKKAVVLVLLAALVFGVTFAFGHDYANPARFSSLTPEQRTKLQELRSKFNEETAQLKGALVTKRLELQSLWANPRADEKAIKDKEKEMRDLQTQMREKAFQSRLEARKILTPEQLAEIGMHPGPGFGMGPGMGPAMGPGMGYGMRHGMGRGMGHGPGMCF